MQCHVVSVARNRTRRDANHCHSRDRLVFSKSLLRRFLRECLDRDSSLASPWTVKPVVAQRFGIPTDMPEDIRAEVALVRKGEIDKRKKVWEEKEAQAEREGRLTKKMIREREREAKGIVNEKYRWCIH